MKKYQWAQMRWPEIKAALDEDPIVIVLVGSLEQHGPALPVWTDSHDVEVIAHKAAEQLLDQVRVLVTPLIWFGYSWHHMDIPGSITLDYDTLTEVTYQVCRCILHHGFKRILILNGHGGNDAPINWALERLYRDYKIVIPRVTHWDLIIPEEESYNILEGRPAFGHHPGEYETALNWAINPELVSTEDMKNYYGKPKSKFLTGGRATIFNPNLFRSDRGGNGLNALATKEKGEKLFEFTVKQLVEFLKDFKTWDVEDITSLYSHE